MAAVDGDGGGAVGGANGVANDDALNPLAGIGLPDQAENEATKDEGEFDEENDTNMGAKPKRGRGRPPAKKKDDESALLRKELDDLKNENVALTRQLTSYTNELRQVEDDREQIRSMLAEKEQDYNELLQQFSQRDEEECMEKPTGIVFFDSITEPLSEDLPSKVKWSYEKAKLSEITVDEVIKQADVVLLFTGSEELQKEKGGYQMYVTTRNLLEEISKTTMVNCICLPPSRSATIQVDMYNLRLSSLELDNPNINVLKLKTDGSRSRWINEDGSPTQKCVRFYKEALNTMTTPVSIKSKSAPATASASLDRVVTCFVNVKADNIGKIIGKNGNVVKRITESHDVKVKFGRWSDPAKEKRDDSDDSGSGALVIGMYSDVLEAIDMIKSIERGINSRSEEPQEKKRKF